MAGKRVVAAAIVVGMLAAGCGGGSSGEDEGSGAGGDGGGGWSFTDDRGVTHTLDEVPDVVVAQSVSAGGLWEYGVEVAGAFGPLRRPDGTPDPSIGLADPDAFASLGEVEGEVNLEALAALQPDIIVTQLWSDDSFWGIDDELDEMEALAPVVGIRVGERPVDEPLARLAELATSLGGDPGDGVDTGDRVAEARAGFDQATDRLAAALADRPGLRVLAASGTPAEMYVAHPPGFPDLRYYQSLGMDLVEPEEHPTGQGYWETLSWEEADKYPADLVLADVRGATLEQLLDQMPPTAAALPAVAADQVIAWPASFALGYGNVAAVLDEVRAAVEAADPGIA